MNLDPMPNPNPGHPKRRWLRPVTIWVPTWRMLIPGLVLLGGLVYWAGHSVHGFLSVSQPVTANVLVVEGWSPDYALVWAVEEFDRGQYDLLIAAGGPMDRGSLVSGYPTYADIAAATLGRLGIDPARLATAPAEATLRNRTHVSARGVRELLDSHAVEARGLNLVSVGTHARRSWVVYRKTLGDQCAVGILSVPPEHYDPAAWWTSSAGVKGTIVETLGWLYESLFDGGR
jgi:hypothetical protein